MTEELAFIRDVGVGLRDTNYPIMWFSVITISGGALQVFDWEAAAKIVKEASVYEVHGLEGKPCVVDHTGSHMKFVRLFK